MPTFMWSDLLQIALGLILGIAVILLPGYALGWICNFLNFRERSALAKICLSAPFGISLLPILIYLPYRFISVRVAIAFVLALACVGAFALALRGSKGLLPPVAVNIAVGVWVLIAVFSLADVRMGDRVYNTALTWDHGVRTQIVAALSHSNRLPLESYMFHPGHPTVIRYHYFSYFFPSFMERFSFGRVTARSALDAYVIWLGIALLATVAAYLRFFLACKDRKAVLVAWSLMAIAGLQVVPFLSIALVRAVHGHTDAFTLPSLVLWNTEAQVNSWLDSLLWVPNHVSALVGLLIGCLLLWDAREKVGRSRWLLVVGSGIAFASGVGLSVYVCLMFAIFLSILVPLLARSHRRQAVNIMTAGILASVLALPFLMELIAPGNAPTVFSISIRGFDVVNIIVNKFDIGSHSAKNVLSLIGLPLNYFSELGLFFCAGIWWLRDHKARRSFTPSQRLMLYMLGLSFFLCSFIRSFPWNDFGWRGLLPAQFVLVLMATQVFWSDSVKGVALPGPRRQIAFLLLFVGLASSFTELAILRLYSPLVDRGLAVRSITLNQTPDTGHHTAALRSAYDWVRRHTPADAIVQQNPDMQQEIALGLYSERPTSIFGRSFLPLGTSREYREFRSAYAVISQLFQPGVTSGRASEICGQAGLDYLVVQDVDPVWKDKTSFVWSGQPVYQSPLVRVFHCR